MVGAGSDLVVAGALVEGAGTYRPNLKSVVRKDGNGVSSEQDIAVDENSALVVAYVSVWRLK